MKSDANTGASGVGSLVTKIGGLVTIAYIGQKAIAGMFSAIITSALQQVQETTYQALLNSDKIGTQMYAYTKAYGNNSVLGVQNTGKAVTTFLNSTRDISQVEQLLKLTERLYAKGPEQSKDGALFAMKELMAGDTMSVKERYNMIGFSGEKIRNFANKGDTSGLISYLDQMFNKFGATEEVANRVNSSLLANVEIFKDRIKTAIGEQATPVMETLALTVQKLNADMDAGKFQPFINLMVYGMESLGNEIAWVAENANWLIPVVGGLVLGVIAYNTAMAVANIVTASMAVTTQALVKRFIKVFFCK